jgi:uncharacterized protein (TIGR03437 family)
MLGCPTDLALVASSCRQCPANFPIRFKHLVFLRGFSRQQAPRLAADAGRKPGAVYLPQMIPAKMASMLAVAILAVVGIWSSSQTGYAEGRAYVANFGSGNVSVIDTSSNTVIATVMVGSQPQGIAVTPDGASVYVAHCGGDVWVINTATNKVSTKFQAGACPTGVVITPDGTRAYVTLTNANSVAVIDTSSYTVMTKIPVGDAPSGIAITPDGTRVYVANAPGSVSVIDTSSNTVAATVNLGNVGSVGVAITPDGTRAYVANPVSGSVSVIDTSSNTVADTITVANVADSPVGVAITPDGTRAYVVTYGFGGMGPTVAIDTSTNTIAAMVSVGTGPTGVGISPDGTRAYVTIATNVTGVGNGAVTVIDTSSNTVVDTVPVGSTPFGIVITSGSSAPPPPPSISSGGIVPATVQPGQWVSIYGSNLAAGTTSWTGNFPTSLGGASVTIDGKLAYLSYVSPGQINLQIPNDSKTGAVPVAVTAAGGTGSSSVTLAQFGPTFFLLDGPMHVAGIILRSDGSGAYGGGSYDILGPTGNSLGYATVAAKPGDVVELYGSGFGPTNPKVLAGQAFSGAAPTTNPVTLDINNVSVTPAFAGLSGAGLYQINLTVPSGLGTGEVPLQAMVGGVETPAAVFSLQ